jgi:hypothetical protein
MSPAKIHGRVDRALKIGVLAVLFLSVSTSWSRGSDQRGVDLLWDASTSEDVAGYRVYWGPSSRDQETDPSSNAYPKSLDVGNSFRVLLPYPDSVSEGTWYFAVTAIDQAGNESVYSNEVHALVDYTRPEAPACHAPIVLHISP